MRRLFKVCAIRILYTGRSISRGHAKLTLNGLQYRFVLQRLILYIRINNRPGVLCWCNCWFTRKVILKLNVFIIIVFRHLFFFFIYFILSFKHSDCGSFPFSNDKYKHNWGHPFEITYDILITAINGTLKTHQKESQGFWRDNILSWASLAL